MRSWYAGRTMRNPTPRRPCRPAGENAEECPNAAAHLVASFKPAIEDPWSELLAFAQRWLAHPFRLQPDLVQVLQPAAE